MSLATLASICAIFDRYRLTQARELRGVTKHALAEQIAVSPSVVGQYEAGISKPSPETLAKLSLALGMPLTFFAMGRPAVQGDEGNFRSLRSTTRTQRRQAIVPALFAGEIAIAISKYVRLPIVDLPHLELCPSATLVDLEHSAVQARSALGLDEGPLPHVVRLLESRGTIVTRVRSETERVSAFSCALRPRPVVVLSTNKGDKARSRMDAAHELGHLLLHHEPDPGSQIRERQANAFAAAFLLPANAIRPYLPRRLSWRTLIELKMTWGVSIAALLYRSRTLGVISEPAFRRAMVELGRHRNPDGSTWRTSEPADLGEPEQPALLKRASSLAAARGIGLSEIADEVCLPIDLVAELIGVDADDRPTVDLQAGLEPLRIATTLEASVPQSAALDNRLDALD